VEENELTKSEEDPAARRPPPAARVERHAPRATLHVTKLADALDTTQLDTLSSDALIAFLTPRRWFGAKARKPSSARFRDAIRLPWENGRYAIARLEVTTGSGETKQYQVPLCVRSDDEIGDAPPKSVIARVVAGDGEGLLFDAVEDGGFLRALAEAFARGGSFGAEAGKWIVEPLSAKSFVVPPNAELKVGSAEQSNTSLIIGEQAILKLFRRLEEGENPDVELTRFLTIEAKFAHTPTLLGVIHFEEGGATSVAGMLQEFLPKSVDAWSYALDRGKPYFQAAKDKDVANTFLSDAEKLGVVTRAMHEALATGQSANLAAEPVRKEELQRWASRARDWVRDGLSLLQRQLRANALPKPRAAEAEALATRTERYLGVVDEIVNSVSGDAGLATRIHGDYHLGQVLRTARDDFMIIDFEGEPARSLPERREKASPLRDVAGMLRSFAYAAATLGTDARALDLATRELRVGRWERDVREAFLHGYLRDEGKTRGILPSDAEHTRALIRLFETEKAFYELMYELNNRPDWVWIPMRGIAKLL